MGGVGFDLFANPSDVNRHGGSVDKGFLPPDAIKDLLSAENAIWATGKQLQDGELPRRQRDLKALETQLSSIFIDGIRSR